MVAIFVSWEGICRQGGRAYGTPTVTGLVMRWYRPWRRTTLSVRQSRPAEAILQPVRNAGVRQGQNLRAERGALGCRHRRFLGRGRLDAGVDVAGADRPPRDVHPVLLVRHLVE